MRAMSPSSRRRDRQSANPRPATGRSPAHPRLRQAPDAEDPTADTGHGEQTIDRLPDAGDQEERRKTDSPQDDRTPPENIEQEGQRLQRHEQQQFPTGTGQETRDRSRTLGRDERDHHAQSQDQRELNTEFHAAPTAAVAATRSTQTGSLAALVRRLSAA